MIGFFLQQQQHILSLYLCFKDVKEGGHACCKPQTTSSLIRVLASTSTWTSPTAVFLQESTKATKVKDVERRTGLMERDVERRTCLMERGVERRTCLMERDVERRTGLMERDVERRTGLMERDVERRTCLMARDVARSA